MNDFQPFSLHEAAEKYRHLPMRLQVFLRRWVAFIRESSLAGCYWELKDSRFWPKWLLGGMPVCLFAVTLCVAGYGWQSIVSAKWHTTSTYHRQLAIAAYSHKLRPNRHDEWVTQRKLIHRQWLTLLDRLSTPVRASEVLAERARESGLILRHLAPVENEGRQSYSLRLEGTFGGIMKFLFGPIGKSIWTIDAMTIEFAATAEPLGSMRQAVPNQANSRTNKVLHSTSESVIKRTQGQSTRSDPAAEALDHGSQPLGLAVVLSWVEPQRLASAFPEHQSDIQHAGKPADPELLRDGVTLLDKLTYTGFATPQVSPFDVRPPQTLEKNADVTLAATTASVEAAQQGEIPLVPPPSGVVHGYSGIAYLGTFSDQRGQKALVKVGDDSPAIVGLGALIPTLELKVIALDKHVLTLQHTGDADAPLIRLTKHGLQEHIAHE